MSLPNFSIVLPIYNTPPEFLWSCIHSVITQDFKNWELIIVDDASIELQCVDIAESFSLQDDRISVTHRVSNGGIIAASNDGLKLCRGEFVVFLDHDDMFEPDALSYINCAIRENSDVDVVYTDEYILSADGKLTDLRKPDWSPVRLCSQNYVGHITAMRRTVVQSVGGFYEGYEGAQDYDLLFRVTEIARNIVHVPIALYFWRDVAHSYSRTTETRDATFESGRRAVESHCQRTGISAVVERTDVDWVFRIRQELIHQPLVSLIVWGPNASIASYAIVQTSTYQNFDVITVPTARDKPDALNSAAAAARGDVLVFVEDTIEVMAPDWCESMLQILQNDTVGIVGGMLWSKEHKVRHAGYRFVDGQIRTFAFGVDQGNTELLGHAYWQREVSAISDSLLMIHKDHFRELGGYSVEFHNALGDIDLCLKAQQHGLSTVLCPFASMMTTGEMLPNPRSNEYEREVLSKRWWHRLHNDPYDKPMTFLDNPWQSSTYRRSPRLSI